MCQVIKKMLIFQYLILTILNLNLSKNDVFCNLSIIILKTEKK